MWHDLGKRFNCVVLSSLLAIFWVLMYSASMGYADSATGSITVHKSLGEGQEAVHSLPGITFQLQKVTDLPELTPEALLELEQNDPWLFTTNSTHTFGSVITTVTDSQGLARFQNLEDGVYLITEQPSRVGDSDYSVVTPFLVSLPGYGHTVTTGLGSVPDKDSTPTRDLHVYAKNQAITFSFYGSDPPTCVGRTMDVWLSGTVPAPDKYGKLHRYQMAVKVDPGFLEPQTSRVWLQSGTGTENDLELNQDYTVAYYEAQYAVIIELTAKGLAKLAQARKQDHLLTVRTHVAGIVDPEAEAYTYFKFRGFLYPDGHPMPSDVAQAVDPQGVAKLMSVSTEVATSQVITEGCELESPTPVPTNSTVVAGPLPNIWHPFVNEIKTPAKVKEFLAKTGPDVSLLVWVMAFTVLILGVILMRSPKMSAQPQRAHKTDKANSRHSHVSAGRGSHEG